MNPCQQASSSTRRWVVRAVCSALLIGCGGHQAQAEMTRAEVSRIVDEISYRAAWSRAVNCEGDKPCGVATTSSERAALFKRLAKEAGADAFAPIRRPSA
jgi:hypothetical protein